MSDRRHATHIPLSAVLVAALATCLSGTPCMATPSATPPDEVRVELDGNEIQPSGNAKERQDLPRTDASENPVMGVLAAVAVVSGGVAIWAHRKAR